MRLLLVEDDPSLGKAVSTGLTQEGYQVDWIDNGRVALEALKTEAFDLVVLDLSLPELSGLTVLQYMRTRKIKVPVLILTARDSIDDRVKGLDFGADDYMTKPFDFDELTARLRALQRRSTNRASTRITYRNIVLDPTAHTVTVDNEHINIPRREFDLLQKLLENIGTVVSRSTLSQCLYKFGEEVDSNTLEVHIHNIRKKLGINCISTIRGVGYMVVKEDKTQKDGDDNDSDVSR
jgi:two-component system, OmpR family, response regulator QseB